MVAHTASLALMRTISVRSRGFILCSPEVLLQVETNHHSMVLSLLFPPLYCHQHQRQVHGTSRLRHNQCRVENFSRLSRDLCWSQTHKSSKIDHLVRLRQSQMLGSRHAS